MSLQNWIDTDAIRQLVDHESDTWRFQFEARAHTVTITGNPVSDRRVIAAVSVV